MSNEIILIESKYMRNENVYRDYVMDKVKIVPALNADDEVTLQMAAKYYEVNIETVRQALKRNRDEFNEYSEVRMLKGKVLKEFKAMVHDVPDLVSVPSLQLLNRRGLLRLGMMLTESEVARSIRNYLLNVEEVSEKEQRKWAVDREMSKRNRRMLTDAIKEFCEGVMNGHEYATYTNLVYATVFDCKASELREMYGLDKKDHIRDALTTEDLKKVVNVERAISTLLTLGKDYECIKEELQNNSKNFK